jgi:hypothetical protein
MVIVKPPIIAISVVQLFLGTCQHLLKTLNRHLHMDSTLNHRVEKLATGNVYHFIDQFLPNPTETLLCIHGSVIK